MATLGEVAEYWSTEAEVFKSKNKWVQLERISRDFRGRPDRVMTFAEGKLAARESGQRLAREVASGKRSVYTRSGYQSVDIDPTGRYVKQRIKATRQNESGPARRALTQMARGARRRPDVPTRRQRLLEGIGGSALGGGVHTPAVRPDYRRFSKAY